MSLAKDELVLFSRRESLRKTTFINQLIWFFRKNKPQEYQDEIVIPEALMVKCFTKLCKYREDGKEDLLPYKNRFVSSTNGSIVNDIFGQETYLLWQGVLVLRKNILPFLKKITDIDSKFNEEEDNSSIIQSNCDNSLNEKNQQKLKILE